MPLSRLEFFGPKQGEEEIGEQAGRDGATEDDVEHRVLLLALAEEHVPAEQDEGAEPERDKESVLHECPKAWFTPIWRGWA